MQYMRKIDPAGGEVGLLSDLFSQATADVPVSRVVTVGGTRISVRMESSLWNSLIEIGEREGKSIDELCDDIEGRRNGIPLSTAIRVFVLHYFREATESV